MTLYKSTCCYRDLDGELYIEKKTVEADSKTEATKILDKYFYKKYEYTKGGLMFSTVKEVPTYTNTVASGKGSVTINGSATNAVIQTGNNNIYFDNAGLHVGETLHSYL
jgi:hypothetical protein